MGDGTGYFRNLGSIAAVEAERLVMVDDTLVQAALLVALLRESDYLFVCQGQHSFHKVNEEEAAMPQCHRDRGSCRRPGGLCPSRDV